MIATTFPVFGLKISAWVSPPHDSVSNIVEVAASIAHAASTAFPPFWKVIAPAVAASGLPVIAIQCLPWRTGLTVAENEPAEARRIPPAAKATIRGGRHACRG